MTQTKDIILFRKWANIMRRMDSMTRDVKSGYGIVTISVLVSDDGEPKFWSEPKLTKLEPKNVRINDIFMELAGVPQIVLTDEPPDDEETD